jgi:hypothetical protein
MEVEPYILGAHRRAQLAAFVDHGLGPADQYRHAAFLLGSSLLAACEEDRLEVRPSKPATPPMSAPLSLILGPLLLARHAEVTQSPEHHLSACWMAGEMLAPENSCWFRTRVK